MGYAEFYLARKQIENGHDVLVITSNHAILGREKLMPGLAKEAGIDVFRVKSACVLRGNACGFSPFELMKVVYDFAPNVIHCHGLLSPFCQIVLMEKRRGYKVVGDMITGISPIASRVLPSLRKFISVSMAKVDAFFVCNKAVERFLVSDLKISTVRVYSIPLGADITSFKPDVDQKEKTRAQLGITNDGIAAIYTGKFLPEKRVTDLLISTNDVIKQYPNFKLILVGDGPSFYHEQMRSLISQFKLQNNVSILKTVHRTKLPSLYNAADFAIWPGTFSISIIEAMACGLPVIIARSKWTAHYLDYNNGYSFNVGNIPKLNGAILNLLSSKELRESMGSNSRKLVEEKLNWDTIAIQYDNVYTRVVSAS